MKRLISATDAGLDVMVIALRAGETFSAGCYMHPDCRKFGVIEEADEPSEESLWNATVTFEVDVLITVENGNPGKGRCKHLRFVRPDRHREGARGLRLGATKLWPRLRVALGRYSDVQKVHAWGGLYFAPTYADEMLVADFSMNGTEGWLIRRKDISGFLKLLPPKTQERVANL